MTLGPPELLVLGYLRNQRLVDAVQRDRVDHRRLGRRRCGRQDPRRHRATSRPDRAPRGHHRLRPGHGVRRPDGAAGRACALPGAPGAHPPEHAARHAGDACASRTASTARPARCTAARCSAAREMLMFVEDVGRHNAIDTIAGWMCDARRARRRQGLLHHRPADQRDGDEGGADGRAHRRVAQRRHADGPRTGARAGHDAVRPRRQPAFPLLHAASSASTPSPKRSARRCGWWRG